MVRHALISIVVLVLGAFAAGAQGPERPAPIPETRLLVERDVDFYGSDLRNLFDTTFEACRAACISDSACTAFTFNTRSNACFPKIGVERRESYVGALSALVLRRGPAEIARARDRAEALGFLRQGDLDAARGLAEGLAFDRVGTESDADVLRQAARSARTDTDPRLAVHFTRRALVLDDAADLWTAYARDAMAVTDSDTAEQRKIRSQALPAAINGYLRADNRADQSEALRVLARSLELRNRGREALRSLRLADQTAPSPAITAALDDAIAKYGFRITDSRADSDSAAPRICATFSEPLVKGLDYAPYIQLPGIPFAAEAQGRDLCIDGLAHGTRYRPIFRAGLPAASGEGLIKDTALALYVRDRAASVRFPGRAYVLPRGPAPVLPVASVNVPEVTLSLSRVAERSLRQMIDENFFGRPLNTWEADRFEAALSEPIWTGSGLLETALNTEVTTLLPLDQTFAEMPPGIYAMRAQIPGADPYETPGATQWFIISDLGLTTMEGTDGIRVSARSLATADPAQGVRVRLISRANRVLGSALTDAQGHAVFSPEVSGGRGGAAPALVLATTGPEDHPDDFSFLSLTEPAFDLSDRGVAGRTPPGPVDVFLTTDRGAYRAGETIHATVLSRDGTAQALPDLPLTAILTRPDGVEFTRSVSDGGIAGGHDFALRVPGTAPRGTWALAIHLDPEAPALARQTLLVEDFLPERIDVTVTTPEVFQGPSEIQVQADYLFGAPAGDLPLEGEAVLRAAEGLADWPGYQFGRHDEPFEPVFRGIPATRTDGSGAAAVALDLTPPDAAGRPIEAQITVRVSEGSGRPVERRTTAPVASADPMLGIKSRAGDVVPEGTEARFQIVSLGPDGATAPAQIRWVLNRVTRRYQWYQRYGNWEWEPISRRTRIATGEAQLDGAPLEIGAPVDWGRYELVVERIDGSYAASSVAFSAGWYAATEGADSPDRLEVSLDRDRYSPGDVARLRIVPQAPGQALVTVMSNRVIDQIEVPVTGEATTVDLPVTEDWGAGAYVTATIYRPVSEAGARVPTRALGLAHAAVDPGTARLVTRFEAPTQARPRAPLPVALKVDAPQGSQVWATIAAVDQGILNLTAHASPDPEGHYFGQHRLGLTLRDLYGRLIDTSQGSLGRLRSGGDASARLRMQAPPPTEDLVAFFSGPLEVGADGYARTTFDMPSFNGTVRLMAVAWSQDGIGQAEAEVLVRDPVVLTASVPRFLSPGDVAQMRLDLVHAEGPTGLGQVALTASGLDLGQTAFQVDLAKDGQVTLPVEIRATEIGLAEIGITLTTPGGARLTKALRIPVQVNDPEIARTSRFALGEGATFTLSRDVFAGLHPGTGAATVAVGALARFDVPGLLGALDRYPYGCTEQVISRSLPLLYLDPLATALGLHQEGGAAARVAQSIDVILSRQTSSGGFGLWQSYDSDPWLNAYATDFLSRAHAQGHSVPDAAMERARDALQNAVNTAPDFDRSSPGGNRGLAYALYVLAREGAANIGDLRYYADVKGADFDTPLARAQLGAALAAYGELERSERMFALAQEQLDAEAGRAPETVWRSDYGTRMRDAAAVLTLATEAGSTSIDSAGLADRVARPGRMRSSQEQLWTVLAAHALAEGEASTQITVDGQPADHPVLRFDDGIDAPLALANTGAETDLTVTTFGVPQSPPQADGDGYAITRSYYTLEGAVADPTTVAQGARLVAVLTVTPFGPREGRLMVSDPLPAGFEIDNPTLLRGGDIGALDWLEVAPARHAEFRQDRFLAAVDWRQSKPFSLAYIVRAVSPGAFYHPAASVEDMYRPQYRANTDAARVTIQQ